MTQPAPDVSIVIPSYNTADAVLEAIASAMANTSASVEVIVVDDCSSDGTPDRVRAEHPAATVIVQPKRSGFAAACNAGIDRAQGELILLLNSDIIITDDAVDRMIAFVRDDNADACGCRLIAPDGSPQPYSTRVPSIGTAMLAALGRGSVVEQQPTERTRVECLQGSCLMMTRDIVERTGPWDEGFFLYCEDVDWCIRARQAGGRLFFLPDIVMTHHRGLSTSADAQSLTLTYHRSLWRLYRKHFAAEHSLPARCFIFAGLACRCLLTLAANVFRKQKSPRW